MIILKTKQKINYMRRDKSIEPHAVKMQIFFCFTFLSFVLQYYTYLVITKWLSKTQGNKTTLKVMTLL